MLLLILCQELVHKHDTFTLVYGGVTSLLFYFSVLSFVWEVFVCFCAGGCLIGSCSPIGATPCLIS